MIRLVHLYPKLMNTYGDTGNIICLVARCHWRNLPVEVITVEIGDPLPNDAHFYFLGGGQDSAQNTVGKDMKRLGSQLHEDIGRGVPLLAICGGYQLLGKHYLPFNSDPILGTGLFPVETTASNDRMIGNLLIEANTNLKLPGKTGTIVGFENHSGKTSLVDTKSAKPLGKVLSGFGNNGQDKTEGCVVGNAIGCYLHGSVLPKNPHLADWLLEKAAQQVNPDFRLSRLPDREEWAAHRYIVGRYL